MTEDSTPTRNVALLIDADNASHNQIDPVLTVLAELGQVNVKRCYGNWSKPGLVGWRDMAIRHGIEPQQQFDLTKGKNATDMKMTIDAMDLLFRGRVEAFGIMSSDSDFMPLVTRIRQDGLPVYGFGSATRTPEGFRQACTRFIDVTAIQEEAAPSVAAASPAPAATPPGSSAPLAVEVPFAESLPPSIAGQKLPVDEALLKLLVDAYNATKRDEKGYVSLSAMGQLAANRSSFDVRNYGYRRLSDLIEAVPNFQIEQRADGRSFVRRLR